MRLLLASQTSTVLSTPAEAMRAPSGDQASAVTLPACPPKVKRGFFALVSQTCTVPSSLAEAMRALFGAHAMALTLSEWPR